MSVHRGAIAVIVAMVGLIAFHAVVLGFAASRVSLAIGALIGVVALILAAHLGLLGLLIRAVRRRFGA